MVPNEPQPGRRAGGTLSAKHYQHLIESMADMLALIGADGVIHYLNPHTERVLGYSSADVVGRNIFDYIHPDDSPRAAQEFSHTIQNKGERIPSMLRIRDATGDWLPFEIIAINLLDDPDIRAILFTARDLRFRREIADAIERLNLDAQERSEERITELARINAQLRLENQARQTAETQLRHTVSLLEATLDSTADAILVVSNEGTVRTCNKKFHEMWHVDCHSGEPDSVLLESVLPQLRSPDQFLARVRSIYADPPAVSSDVIHFRDGRIVERYSQPETLDGRIVGRVWSFRDVTEEKNLESQLRQAQKMEALGRLAGGIAHDFNNLLMLMSGYVTQLRENPKLSEAYSICDEILATAKRAGAVTRQLLSFSRKLPETPAVVDLNVIVRDIQNMLRRLLSEQVELQISLTPEPHPVYADASQLELMLINLAVNAQDAMPEGGLLSIATGCEMCASEGQEGICQECAVVYMSDTGLGMTPEVQARIFEPFFTTKALGKGTGLGLSTVFGIVQRAGGRILVDSEPDRGTTFRVYLPQVNVSPEVAPSRPSFMPVRGNETILLAEDEAGIRSMTRAYLESLGYYVLEAKDGPEAIRRSLEYSGVIHLVLTDVLMPGLRGDAAVDEIRKHRPGIKTLFVSGYTDENLSGKLKNILHKPFEFPELGHRLRSILDSRSDAQLHPPAAD